MRYSGSPKVDMAHVSPGSILLADGDPELVEVLKVGFELTWPRSTVLTAHDGESAIRLIEQQLPSIALLELALKVRDGYEVLARIRTMSDMPVIIISATNNVAHIVRAFEMGADDFVSKPFGSLELLARMRSLLRRSSFAQGLSAEPPLSVGDIAVHFSQRRVDVVADKVPLTCAEHSIITLLARELGHPVTHRQLNSVAWGTVRSNCYDRLKACIWRLRNKVEPDPRNPIYIQSVRGVGYVLVDPGRDYPSRRPSASLRGEAAR